MKIDKRNLCIVTMPYWHYTLDYGLESIRSCGFQNIEFWAASPHYCYMDYTPEERSARKREIISRIEAYGLKMPVFYPEQLDRYAFLNIASPSAYIQSTSMERMMEYLEDTVAFGAGAMVLSAGWQCHDTREQANYDRSVMAVKKLAERARDLGIVLLMEPSSKVTGTFIWNLTGLQGFLKDVDMPNVKACLNTTLVMDSENSLEEWLTALKDQVGHIHFADKGGQTLGKGGADVAAQLRLLEKLNYGGLVSLNISFRDCCVNPDRAVFASAKWLETNKFM